MRKKIVAGNWKMNLSFAEAMALIDNLVISNENTNDVEIILASPFIYLHQLINRIQSNPSFYISAQNCSEKMQGAYTGEVSASMLTSIGVDYVLIGHSERRQYFHETHDILKEKINRSLENGLLPIFCCGEQLNDRNSEQQFDIVKKQIEDSLFHLNNHELGDIVIAYEPVWAIGTGKTASATQAQEMHEYIRKIISDRYSKALGNQISILYGGSVNSQNAKELFECDDIDGALVGGASLKESDFNAIIKALIAVS